MSDLKQLPSIADADRNALVAQLLGQIEHLLEENRRQSEIIQQMRDEIAVLKGQKAKPKFKPSGMQTETETEPDGDPDGREDEDSDSGDGDGTNRKPQRPGSSKRSKTQQLEIHETQGCADGADTGALALQGISRLHRARHAHPSPQHLLSP